MAVEVISNIFWSVSVIINIVIIIVVVQLVLLLCCCCRRKDAFKRDLNAVMRNHNMTLDDETNDDQYIEEQPRQRKKKHTKQLKIENVDDDE